MQQKWIIHIYLSKILYFQFHTMVNVNESIENSRSHPFKNYDRCRERNKAQCKSHRKLIVKIIQKVKKKHIKFKKKEYFLRERAKNIIFLNLFEFFFFNIYFQLYF